MKHFSIIIALVGLLALAACGTTGGSAATAPTTVTVTGSDTAHTDTTRTVTTSVTATRTVTEPAKTVVITTESTVTTTEETTEDDLVDDDTPTGLTIGKADGITSSNDDGAADVRVLGVERTTDGGDDGDLPEHGVYLLIDVQYEATNGSYDYNQFDWTIRDAQGRTYQLGDGGSYYADVAGLSSGTVAKGSKARGIVVIDAPEGALTLEFGGGFGNAPASWDVPAS